MFIFWEDWCYFSSEELSKRELIVKLKYDMKALVYIVGIRLSREVMVAPSLVKIQIFPGCETGQWYMKPVRITDHMHHLPVVLTRSKWMQSFIFNSDVAPVITRGLLLLTANHVCCSIQHFLSIWLLCYVFITKLILTKLCA